MSSDLTCFLCETCGTQYSPSPTPPPECPICEDPRQYVGVSGQKWTTLDKLRQAHRNVVEELEPGLHAIHTDPKFAIGQRALLLQTPQGNILWDCIALLDQETENSIRKLGGIRAIAISHPHYYTTMIEWSSTFDNAPIYLHEDERKWVMRPHDNVRFWSGEEKTLLGDLTLIRCGGHFAGFQVLHWPGGADGRGALLSGDQPQVCPARGWLAFMYSYPNYIPLNRSAVERIDEALRPYAFDRIHGAFPNASVMQGGKSSMARSVRRHLDAISG